MEILSLSLGPIRNKLRILGSLQADLEIAHKAHSAPVYMSLYVWRFMRTLLSSFDFANDFRISLGAIGPNRLGCYCEGDVTYWFSWWAHQDSNLGPTDYESLADNQPQLTTTACVT